MGQTYTVRNLPRGIRERIRAYAREHRLKTADAVSRLVLYGLERSDESKPYTLRDLDKFVFRGRDTDGSMRVDEIVYGVGRPKK
jgi:hypothetical protein